MKKIRQTVLRFSLLSPEDRVIVAVSGGADSVCLLNCLVELSYEFRLQLLAAHFNHRLRGSESDKDQQFVEELCNRLGVELITGSADLKEIAGKRKGSIEELCRESRYNFLLSVLRDRGFGKIALGHNLDDQAETVLMNVIRGAGIDGLKGIEPFRDVYIRPLLEITRAEIVGYLKGKGISFRSDSSNLDNSFRRNSIRNGLIPEIRNKYNPSVTAALGRLAGIAQIENRFLDKIAREALDLLQPRIKLDELLKYDPAVRNRIIKMALEDLSPVKGGISFRHVIASLDVITGRNPGASIYLPYGIFVRREYEYAVIGREVNKKRELEFQYVVDVPGILYLKEAGMEFRFAFLKEARGDTFGIWKVLMDYGKVVPPLIFRNIRQGDWIQPFGMRGRKKLQDVLTDKKVPRTGRWNMPVLADSESILWVPGVVASERMRIAGSAENVLSVEKV